MSSSSPVPKCLHLMDFSPSELHSFFCSFDTVMTDCDGVLWHGMDTLGHTPQAVQSLRKTGKRVFFCTNNSTKTREEYVQKCDKLGFGGDIVSIFLM